MILIAQSASGPRYAEVVARLVQAGHHVMVTHSRGEAFSLIPDLQPRVVLVEAPEVDQCPHALCGWVRSTNFPPPRLVGMVRIEDPGQRSACEECMTVLRPETHPSLVAATVMAAADDKAPQGANPMRRLS